MDPRALYCEYTLSHDSSYQHVEEVLLNSFDLYDRFFPLAHTQNYGTDQLAMSARRFANLLTQDVNTTTISTSNIISTTITSSTHKK